MPDDSLLKQREGELYRPNQPISSGIPAREPLKEPPAPPSEPPAGKGREWWRWEWVDRAPLKKGLLVIVVLGVLIAALLLWRGVFSFNSNRVELTLEPTEGVAVGEETTWKVHIENNNMADLREGELTLIFPERSFHPQTGERVLREARSISLLPGREEHEEEFSAVFVAGEEKKVQVLFSFKQEGSNVTFEEEEVFIVRPAEFPIDISVFGPAETVSGEQIAVEYKLRSKAKVPLTDVRARLVYPKGFIVSRSSIPLESAHTIWPVGRLEPGEERILTVFGTVSGQAEEGKVFRIFFEGREGPTTWKVYKEATGEVRLSNVPLEVEVDGSETARPGELLTYTIRWHNSFDVPLSHVTVTAAFSGQMLDTASLRTSGAFDARTNTIEWSEAHIPSLATLAPNQGGETSFSIELKENYQPTGLTNPTALIRIIVSSPSQPQGLTTSGVRSIQEYVTRIEGRLEGTSEAFYTESLAPIVNTGPYPPRLGKDSTFTVHWRVRAFANSFGGVTMSAVLPSGIEWADETYLNGDYGKVEYDSFTRTVRWAVGELKANQGLFSQVPEAVFKLRARPSPAQVGQTLPILSESELSGTDTFTNTQLEIQTEPLDSSVQGREGRVQP